MVVLEVEVDTVVLEVSWVEKGLLLLLLGYMEVVEKHQLH
jgi:hypothetical protein